MKVRDVPVHKLKLTPRLAHEALTRAYYKELRDFTREILNSFNWFVLAEYKKYVPTMDASPVVKMRTILRSLLARWEQKAREKSKPMAAKMETRARRYVNGKYKTQYGPSMIVDAPIMTEIDKARIAENVRLIKSIPQDVFNDYSAAVYNNIFQGDLHGLEERLKTIGGISERRARTIARDQVKKALEGANQAMAQSLGFEYYIWDTSMDERVSTGYGGHKQLEGLIFRFDKPEAIIDTYGNKGHPGQRVNCRCNSRAIFIEPGQKVVKTDYGYKLVESS